MNDELPFVLKEIQQTHFPFGALKYVVLGDFHHWETAKLRIDSVLLTSEFFLFCQEFLR